MKIFRDGLATGLVLQLAIGPVFFFIIYLTLQGTMRDGLAGALAVTLVDFIYIALAIFGLGKLLENKKTKKTFGVLSSIILIIFGMIIIQGIPAGNTLTAMETNPESPLASFISVFFLTITSPMTIVFFTSIFMAKAVEYNYTKKELAIFGFGTGLATLVFMGTAVMGFSFLKGAIPILLSQVLNLMVGYLLIGYGGIRLVKILKYLPETRAKKSVSS